MSLNEDKTYNEGYDHGYKRGRSKDCDCDTSYDNGYEHGKESRQKEIDNLKAQVGMPQTCASTPHDKRRELEKLRIAQAHDCDTSYDKGYDKGYEHGYEHGKESRQKEIDNLKECIEKLVFDNNMIRDKINDLWNLV